MKTHVKKKKKKRIDYEQNTELIQKLTKKNCFYFKKTRNRVELAKMKCLFFCQMSLKYIMQNTAGIHEGVLKQINNIR